MIDLDIDGIEGAEEIGRGGFATVYAAEQPRFRRRVAVKVLNDANLDEENRHRFERECGAMGSLSTHRHIVTVHDAGFTKEGRPYLVMAHMSGGSLGDRLKSTGPLPWSEMIEIGTAIAEALEVAHERGVVHRDIKPDNILVSEFGDVQLSDFGIARISGGDETKSGVVTASLAHAPPEILDGAPPTHQSDIYSLASTLYTLAAGHAPFESESDETQIPQIRRIISDPVPPLVLPGMPDAVASALISAMAKDPGARPASAAEFGSALALAAESSGSGASVVGNAGETVAFQSMPVMDDADPVLDVQRQKRRLGRVGVGLAIVSVAVAAGLLIASSASDDGDRVGASSTTAESTTTTAPTSETIVPPSTVFVAVEDRHIIVLDSFQKAEVAPAAADVAGRQLLVASGIPAVRTRIIDSDNFASLANGLWVVTINEFYPSLEEAASACWDFGLTDASDCSARPLSQDSADLSVVASPAP